MRKSKTCAAKWASCANALAHEISELRERMAHLEGLLEGLREAITGRIAASQRTNMGSPVSEQAE